MHQFWENMWQNVTTVLLFLENAINGKRKVLLATKSWLLVSGVFP